MKEPFRDRASKLIARESWLSAEAWAMRQLDIDRDHVAAHFCLADAQLELRRYEAALETLEHVSELLPAGRMHHVHWRRGHLERQRGNFERAAACYQKAIAGRPEDVGYRVFLGNLLFEWGLLDQSVVVCEEATRCSVGAVDEAFLNLGYAHRGLGDLRAARTCFERALEIDSSCEHARAALDDLVFVEDSEP